MELWCLHMTCIIWTPPPPRNKGDSFFYLRDYPWPIVCSWCHCQRLVDYICEDVFWTLYSALCFQICGHTWTLTISRVHHHIEFIHGILMMNHSLLLVVPIHQTSGKINSPLLDSHATLFMSYLNFPPDIVGLCICQTTLPGWESQGLRCILVVFKSWVPST